MKIFAEILLALLIAIPLALLVIFDLPGLGIILAIGLVGYAYVMKKNHEAELAGQQQPPAAGPTVNFKKAA